MKITHEIHPGAISCVGTGEQDGTCCGIVLGTHPITGEKDTLRFEGSMSDVLNVVDDLQRQIRTLIIARGDQDPYTYVSMVVVDALRRESEWNRLRWQEAAARSDAERMRRQNSPSGTLTSIVSVYEIDNLDVTIRIENFNGGAVVKDKRYALVEIGES